jgi:hypothetical protein
MSVVAATTRSTEAAGSTLRTEAAGCAQATANRAAATVENVRFCMERS